MSVVKSYISLLRGSLLSILFLLVFVNRMQASMQDQTILVAAADTGHAVKAESSGKGKFNAGEMIMEHVVDNHEWHVAEIGNLDLTIPFLLSCFMMAGCTLSVPAGS